MAVLHRARTPAFWLPRRKPVGPVELDPATPFAALSTVWWLGEHNPLIKRDGGKGFNLTAAGNPAPAIGPHGPYRVFDGSTTIYNTGETRSGALSYLVVCMRSEATPTDAVPSRVELVLGGRDGVVEDGSGFTLDLGNGFGAAEDLLKPRAAVFNGGAVVGAAIDGVAQASVNPFATALPTGKWAGIAVSFSGVLAGPNLGFGGIPSLEFLLKGGIQLVVEWRGVAFPAPLLAKLSADPYAIFRPAERRTISQVPAVGGVSGDALISVGAAVVAAGTKTAQATAAIDTGAAVATSGIKIASGNVAIGAGAAVQASGAKIALGSAAIDAGAAVDGAGTKTAIGDAAIAVGAAVIASGGSGTGGDVVISAGVAVIASGIKIASSQATIAAGAAVTAAGAKSASGQAAVSAGAEIIVLGSKRARGDAVIAAGPALVTTWRTIRYGSVVVALGAQVTAAGAAVGLADPGVISLTGRVDGPAALTGRAETTIQLQGRK